VVLSYFLKLKKLLTFVLTSLFFLNILAWIVVYDLKGPRFLEVNFFDVGQGDAIFIVSPQRHQILIDGGPDSTILEKLGKEMPFWDRSIDLIILTHPEKDHLAGLIEVLKRYKVENILWTGVVRDTAEFKEWEKLIKKEKAKIKIAQANQKVKWSKSDIDQIEILYPFEDSSGQEFKNSNNTSVVAKLIFNENSFLFTGDIYKSVEKKLLEHYVLNQVKHNPIDSDVLKVGHHGSKTSTSEEFLKAITPEIAVIQVGENNYGHPHPEVLLNLEKFAIEILRTDKNGDIKIVSDGNNLKIKNKK
jgi:competence protein ComEC